MEYVYHLKPKEMQGKILLPLSVMKKEYPKLYRQQVKLYKGREDLLDKEIPLLKCDWKDVLFLSAINPEIIFAALEMLGLLDEDVSEILKFPITALDKNICLYQEVDGDEKFEKVRQASYEEEITIPTETLEYFIECVKNEEDPLIFSGIPHILYKGTLDISKAKRIRYKRLTKNRDFIDFVLLPRFSPASLEEKLVFARLDLSFVMSEHITFNNAPRFRHESK